MSHNPRNIDIGRRTITVRAGGQTITIPRGRGDIRNARRQAAQEAARLEQEQEELRAQNRLEKRGLQVIDRSTTRQRPPTAISTQTIGGRQFRVIATTRPTDQGTVTVTERGRVTERRTSGQIISQSRLDREQARRVIEEIKVRPEEIKAAQPEPEQRRPNFVQTAPGPLSNVVGGISLQESIRRGQQERVSQLNFSPARIPGLTTENRELTFTEKLSSRIRGTRAFQRFAEPGLTRISEELNKEASRLRQPINREGTSFRDLIIGKREFAFEAPTISRVRNIRADVTETLGKAAKLTRDQPGIVAREGAIAAALTIGTAGIGTAARFTGIGARLAANPTFFGTATRLITSPATRRIGTIGLTTAAVGLPVAGIALTPSGQRTEAAAQLIVGGTAGLAGAVGAIPLARFAFTPTTITSLQRSPTLQRATRSVTIGDETTIFASERTIVPGQVKVEERLFGGLLKKSRTEALFVSQQASGIVEGRELRDVIGFGRFRTTSLRGEFRLRGGSREGFVNVARATPRSPPRGSRTQVIEQVSFTPAPRVTERPPILERQVFLPAPGGVEVLAGNLQVAPAFTTQETLLARPTVSRIQTSNIGTSLFRAEPQVVPRPSRIASVQSSLQFTEQRFIRTEGLSFLPERSEILRTASVTERVRRPPRGISATLSPGNQRFSIRARRPRAVGLSEGTVFERKNLMRAIRSMRPVGRNIQVVNPESFSGRVEPRARGTGFSSVRPSGRQILVTETVPSLGVSPSLRTPSLQFRLSSARRATTRFSDVTLPSFATAQGAGLFFGTTSRVRPTTRTGIESSVVQRQAQVIRTSTAIIPDIATTTALITRPIASTTTVPRTFLVPPPVPPPSPPPIIFGGAFLPPGGGGRGRGPVRRRGVRAPSGFLPSFTAAVLGLRGSRFSFGGQRVSVERRGQRRFTLAGIRPLI